MRFDRRLGGLHAKFIALVGATLVLMLAVVLLMLQRQSAMQREVVHQSRDSMHALVFERLRVHGEALSAQVADTLVNPLYYFDLDSIGVVARNVLKQPDVRYVLVYDTKGDIIHDGSGDIPTYGQAMRDPLAYEAVSANGVHAQWTDRVLDVSSPIRVGDQRLGGVRIGYSLDGVRADETRAANALGDRLGAIGTQHLWWIGLLLAALVGLGAIASWVLQRALVRPIRQLAGVAQEIETGNYATTVPESRRNDEVGELMRAFGRMGDSIARHDRDIRRMAYTDALTGLANRLAFRESLDQRLMQLRGAGRQLALLFADIDDFKRVNDTLGHDAGDEVLLQFANRIRSAVERYGEAEDTLLARFGGDEFVILLQGGEASGRDVRAQATELAETLVAELGRPIVVQGRQVFLGTSIGITLFPEDAAGATALMKNGDIAMYQAKVAGKSCYRFYSRAMDQAVERRVRMEQDLRGAWERGELSLVYQPIYRLGDGQLVGAEALLRWQHPEQGSIAPSVFIDVAEQSGLIETIGPQVLRAACDDAMRWHTQFPRGKDLFVSVNVSPRQLRSGELPEQVVATLRDTGLPPPQLHIELTETAVIGDEVHASALLARLRSNGVKVWLDDFGTGFSGLSHLRRVPVDGVKIDRSFVSDVLRDPDDLALTTAIIAMAHSLGITVIAEGVEKEGQYAILRERGCDLAQGYWLGHPVGAQEFSGLLA
ncbi:putative bifunctional diguanylate cyclase/phosphodiesterase [Cognatiluteimonas weifangensis]|uniref:EAL domain-containing protein n=1 Tax=Cognatiluteimonas weifangensis TaxID=2303539 RepID=A0A372DRW9_9GAMM|nr:EAL domain-containing protein [Luteimonas weifangensis]RFP62318.1 EAL domain-containing protein [Luteimonas weifangensis]